MALQTINIGASANDGSGDPLRTAMDKINDNFVLLDNFFNVKDPAYGAAGNGTTDDTAAFTAVWAAVLATQVVISNNNYVKNYIYIPPGVYRISGSINWTDLFAWNVHVIAYGAVFLCDGANKNSLDITNSRGIHIKGLTLKGDSTNVPDCGILIGPDGTTSCGNNSLQDVIFEGEWDVTGCWNIGSETTEYINCYFMNSHADTATFAYLADGMNRFGAASDHSTVRAADTAVSFTNNTFKACHFRHYGNGTDLYLENAAGWSFDAGCYYLAFAGANVKIRTGAVNRVANLHLEGLFETTQGSGVEYAVEFLVPAGESSSLANSRLYLNSPHVKTAFLKVTDPAAGTAGTLLFRNCEIRMGYQFYGGATVPLFSSNGVINYLGNIISSGAANVNLSALTSFHGNLYVDAKGSLPAHTLKGFTIYDESSLTLSPLDTGFTLSDNSDPTKVAAFECSGIPTATTRTYTFPNGSGTLLLQTGGITANRVTIGSDGTTVKNAPNVIISNSDELSGQRTLVEANTAGSGAPNILGNGESSKLFTNEGVTAQNYHTLPGAVAGLIYKFYVQDADGIRVVAAAGDTIRIAASVSATGGRIDSTTIGDSVTLEAINVTEWVATAVVGAGWTVT